LGWVAGTVDDVGVLDQQALRLAVYADGASDQVKDRERE
jgi:hypothetical protein